MSGGVAHYVLRSAAGHQRRHPRPLPFRCRYDLRTAANANRQGSGEAPHLLLTVPEACALLRISRWGLYRLIHARQLRTIQIGSRRLIPRASVLELIDKLGQEASS
jgi:excisionase family DNA binding protein